MSDWLVPVLWVGGIGAVCGAALAFAARYLGVEEDPRIEQVTAELPGANCGGCGFAGCAEYAKAMVTAGAATNLCPAGGCAVVARLSAILGRAAEAVEPRVALVRCGGSDSEAIRSFLYSGIADCAAAAATAGGDKACAYGCLGYASCARVCPVGAIAVTDGLARVDPALCIACGKCVPACPRGLIALVPAKATLHVLCSSKDKGPTVKKVCGVGCIGCAICVKLSEGAISMDGFLAKVDYSKPLRSDAAVAKCPGHCIVKNG